MSSKEPTISDYWSADLIIASIFKSGLLSSPTALVDFLNVRCQWQCPRGIKYMPKGEANCDPLHKIRIYLDQVVKKSKSLFKLYNSLTIGRATCPPSGIKVI